MEKIYIHDEYDHNFNAAGEVLPEVLKLTSAKSIVDVGCGIGTWLKVAEDLGINDFTGIDGDYVEKSLMKIPAHRYIPIDLRNRFNLNRKYDLAICLEVAEHLPESSADDFIASITAHADIILFSAAIPNQGGQNHLNEQWTSAYWTAKFREHDFVAVDILRKKFWNNQKVDLWYKQNMTFFAAKASPFVHQFGEQPFYDFIHPSLFLHKIEFANKAQADLVKGIQSGSSLSYSEIFNIILKKLKHKISG
ncbi:MAG: class I SAM-dependent methyltransferase [Chitinophagaceae bacterium]|nr:class I SAM-dependent methyltransferase [Chitinophagaceae bacterium]